MPKGQRLIPDRKKLVAIAYDIESRKIRLENCKDLLWPRFLLAFRLTTTTSKPQQKRGHTIYKTVLSKGCHFFILFAFCISKRTCAEKSVPEFLETIEEHDKSYQFKLDYKTIIAIRNWALEDGEVPGFVEFTDALIDLDITLVKRMLSQRGLQGTDSWTKVMSILFPDYLLSTKPHAAFDERQLAHGQGQDVMEVDAEGATYGGQEAVGVVGEQVPNEAIGGFPNYPEFPEDPTALPQYISFDALKFDLSKFDAPINGIVNFLYGAWPGDEDGEDREPDPT